MVNSWSISGNSCKKIIRAIRVIRLNPLFKKNLCISVVSVGEYSLYSSYSCSRKICVHLCYLWERKRKPACLHCGRQAVLTRITNLINCLIYRDYFMYFLPSLMTIPLKEELTR